MILTRLKLISFDVSQRFENEKMNISHIARIKRSSPGDFKMILAMLKLISFDV